MLEVLRLRLIQLKEAADSPRGKSLLRGLGVCCGTSLILTTGPLWIHKAIMISPFLGFSLLIILSIILFRMWKNFYRDVTTSAFRISRCCISAISSFSQECLWLDSASNKDKHVRSKRQRNRQLVRTALVFLMSQCCMVPENHLVWGNSLLAYIFLVDILKLLCSRNVSLLPFTTVILQIAKLIFASAVLIHQFFFVSKFYVLITMAYFLLSRPFCERKLAQLLETMELDFFEGLEQYYAMGFLGFIEISFTVLLMIWCLTNQLQGVMLLALYTNVYNGGREIIANTMSAAFSEWSLLAHFARATQSDLEVLDDVCAICLAPMKNARITSCKHILHGHCLRRWLKEKQSCPICMTKII